METRNPVEGYFGREFSAICNHCGVMAAWSRKTLKLLRNCCVLEKRPFTVKFSKFCFGSFHCLIDWRVVFKFREMWPTGNRWNRALFIWQKNFAWLSSCRYCADRAHNLARPAPDNVLRVLQISSRSVYFRRSYSRTREHRKTLRKVNPIFGWSLASSRIIKRYYFCQWMSRRCHLPRPHVYQPNGNAL